MSFSIRFMTMAFVISALFFSLQLRADQIPTPIPIFSPGDTLSDSDLNTRFGNIEQTVNTNDNNAGSHAGNAAAHHAPYTNAAAATAAKADLFAQGLCGTGSQMKGIDVNGDIVCSPAQNIISISGIAFSNVPTVGLCPATRDRDGLWFLPDIATPCTGTASAPVILPNLGSISRVDCLVSNTSATASADMTVRLIRFDQGAVTSSVIVTTTTSFAGSGTTTITGSPGVNQVDNSANYYFLEATQTVADGTTVKMHGCKIFL